MRNSLLAFGFSVALLQASCSPQVRVTSPPNKADSWDCGQSNCKVDVYVYLDNANSCIVKPSVEVVIVGLGKKPKITWAITEHPKRNPDYDYRFVFDDGVSPPKHGIAIDDNNSQTDFANPGYERDGYGGNDQRKFRWTSVNKRTSPKTFSYNLFVQRKLSSAPPDDPRWEPCKAVDPKIINQGM